MKVPLILRVVFAAACLQKRAARRTAEEAYKKLEEADRAKDVFLATVSHELRTPLLPIVTWAEVLKRGDLDDEQFRQAVDAIQRSAKVQTQLIEDLLDASRIAAGKMRLEVHPIDLADVIRAAVAVSEPAADAKNIRLQSVLDTSRSPSVKPAKGSLPISFLLPHLFERFRQSDAGSSANRPVSGSA